MASTKIEWADAVWNPVTGCTPISEGCDHCYAKRMATRLAGRYGYPADDPFRPGWWHQEAYDNFKPPKGKRVFVCSMSDLFHEKVPVRAVHLVMEKINAHRDTTFMLLTKRPERMKYLLGERAPEWKSALSWEYDIPLTNLWIGVTAENQTRADKRISILLQIPAAVRFVSIEPMLGSVDLGRYICPAHWHWDAKFMTPEAALAAGAYAERKPQALVHADARFIDWVICGGETGPGARPVHPDWVRSLRDQCQSSGVPFFFKQWGEWFKVRDGEAWDGDKQIAMSTNGSARPWTDDWSDDEVRLMRVGKKDAGRLLDGREWNEFPDRQ